MALCRRFLRKCRNLAPAAVFSFAVGEPVSYSMKISLSSFMLPCRRPDRDHRIRRGRCFYGSDAAGLSKNSNRHLRLPRWRGPAPEPEKAADVLRADLRRSLIFPVADLPKLGIRVAEQMGRNTRLDKRLAQQASFYFRLASARRGQGPGHAARWLCVTHGREPGMSWRIDATSAPRRASTDDASIGRRIGVSL